MITDKSFPAVKTCYASHDDQIGDIFSFGFYGGAYSRRYRIVGFEARTTESTKPRWNGSEWVREVVTVTSRMANYHRID